MSEKRRGGVQRRYFLLSGAATGAYALLRTNGAEGARAGGGFDLEEATISSLQEGLRSGALTARALTQAYLDRIEALDRRGPALRSVIESNPDALEISEALDRERREKGPRGPLHGVPILVKDNLDSADRMATTAGSLALVGSTPSADSFVVKCLREAGAVVLGKANLSEWANIRSDHSSSGWSARGGQCRNPYVLDRNPCGSSSGSGVAVSANLCALAIGTETDGSIVCPSNANGIVGIKPTVGLVSRSGVVPISHTQDTPGPMARTVKDAAILLAAIRAVDPRDAASAAGADEPRNEYTLDEGALRGARIGVHRKAFGFNPRVDRVMEESLEAMKKAGAVLVDPADIPRVGEYDDSELEVLLYELKADLNAYLGARGPGAPVKTLADVIAFNESHGREEMPFFGQELFVKAQAKGPLTDKAYLDALEKGRRLSRGAGLDAVMDQHSLDAVVAPTGGPAWVTDCVNGDHFGGGSSTPAAVAGYPAITVPAGFVFELPVGITFMGRAWSEEKLIRLAYAFEQATKARRPPRFLPRVECAG